MFNDEIINESMFLSEGLFKPKRDPAKKYLTKQELKSLEQMAYNAIRDGLSNYKATEEYKSKGVKFNIVLFKDEKYKVNKKIPKGIGVFMITKTTPLLVKLIRESVSKYKPTNKLCKKVKVVSFEHMGKGTIALEVVLNGDYYYWEN